MISRLTLTVIKIFQSVFCTLGHFVIFLFYVKPLLFPLLEAFRLRPKGVFSCAEPNGDTRTTDKKPGMKFYEIPQSAIAESCRQISFQVAIAVLGARSSAVSLYVKTNLRRLPGQKEE